MDAGFVSPPMKWAHHPNLRKRPRTPAKGRGSVQRAIKRVFAATSASALTSTQVYDWAHDQARLRGNQRLGADFDAGLRLGTRPPPAGAPQVDAVWCLFADAADDV